MRSICAKEKCSGMELRIIICYSLGFSQVPVCGKYDCSWIFLNPLSILIKHNRSSPLLRWMKSAVSHWNLFPREELSKKPGSTSTLAPTLRPAGLHAHAWVQERAGTQAKEPAAGHTPLGARGHCTTARVPGFQRAGCLPRSGFWGSSWFGSLAHSPHALQTIIAALYWSVVRWYASHLHNAYPPPTSGVTEIIF